MGSCVVETSIDYRAMPAARCAWGEYNKQVVLDGCAFHFYGGSNGLSAIYERPVKCDDRTAWVAVAVLTG